MTASTPLADAERSSTPDGGSWTSNKTPTSSARLRAMRRRRSVPHLVLGLLLVLACAGGFLLITLDSGQSQPVLALSRDVTVGHVLRPADLRQVTVAVDPAVSVVAADQAAAMVGQTMAVSLPAGALLTPDAVGVARVPVAGQAIAALPLKPGQLPPEIGRGSPVSVVFVPSQPSGTAGNPPSEDTPRTWPGVVTTVTSSSNARITVVSVRLRAAAAREVAAVPAGQLSLVLLAEGGGR